MADPPSGEDDAWGGVEMNVVKGKQLELVPSHMLVDLNIGWYYLYNPEKKPYKGTIMPVCKLINVVETPIGPRCTILVIGDIAYKEAYADELAPMIMTRAAETKNFVQLFPVKDEQMKIWRLASK